MLTFAELGARAHVRHDLPPPAERRRLREVAGISQTELAAAVGCVPSAISHWEAGDRLPTGRLRERYIEALAVLREAIGEAA